MRILDSGLAAHLESGVTTTCHAWRVTRRDGEVLGFTDHDGDLAFAGTRFLAASGFAASETEAEAGLSAATSEVTGGLSSLSISETDLLAGRYDGARVEVFLVNWADTAQRARLTVQEIGEVTRTGSDFRAELRDLAHRLGGDQGRIYGRRCDARLGDERCRINLDAAGRRAEAVIASVSGSARLVLSGLSGFASGSFDGGSLRFGSGALAGLQVEIDTQGAGGTIGLWLPLSVLPSPGDGVVLTVGCDKSFATCADRFANTLNFQGFPHLPGSDFAYSYADGETRHDGGALFP